MISLSTAVIVSPNDLMADSSNGKKNGTQKLGKQMGSFMNSFMDGLDDQQSAKPAGEIKPKGLAQKKKKVSTVVEIVMTHGGLEQIDTTKPIVMIPGEPQKITVT